MTTIERKYREKCETPSDIHDHLPTLRRYAAQCDSVTELGVRTVVSTWAFLAGLQTRKPAPTGEAPGGAHVLPVLLSVDIAAPEKHGGNLVEVVEAAREGNVDFLFLEADDRQIIIPNTDLLFIDTWHVYEQLQAELRLHADQARKFIILHDTETFWERGETAGHQGLGSAITEFLEEHRREWGVREQFSNCNGLMVLARRQWI
jgi:hypothetical protein